jgi:hypothetical protein
MTGVTARAIDVAQTQARGWMQGQGQARWVRARQGKDALAQGKHRSEMQDE